MKIFIDINLFILSFIKNIGKDYNLEEEDYKCIKKIFERIGEGEYEGIISYHSILVISAILEKKLKINLKEIRIFINEIINSYKVESLTRSEILLAVNNLDFQDIEDSVQYLISINNECDYIITLNIKDYKKSKIKAITPREFCKHFNLQ